MTEEKENSLTHADKPERGLLSGHPLDSNDHLHPSNLLASMVQGHPSLHVSQNLPNSSPLFFCQPMSSRHEVNQGPDCDVEMLNAI